MLKISDFERRGAKLSEGASGTVDRNIDDTSPRISVKSTNKL